MRIHTFALLLSSSKQCAYAFHSLRKPHDNNKLFLLCGPMRMQRWHVRQRAHIFKHFEPGLPATAVTQSVGLIRSTVAIVFSVDLLISALVPPLSWFSLVSLIIQLTFCAGLSARLVHI